LYWSSSFKLLWLLMVCGNAHFGYKSFHTDPWIDFCTYAEVVAHSLLYLWPEYTNASTYSMLLLHSIAETQTCVQALGHLCLQHTTQCTLFQWLRNKFISIFASHKTLVISDRGRRSYITFIAKYAQTFCRKKEMVTLSFFRGNFLSVKRPKMPRGQTKFIKVNQLEMRPTKGQKANYNFFGQTTWSLKKEANLVMLMTGPFSHEVHSGAVLPQVFGAPPSFVLPRKICFVQILKT